MKMKRNEADNKFSKDQIVKSNRFKIYNKDVIKAILKDGTCYSIEEAEGLIKDFLERLV
jgi:hypothetical protein